LDINIGRRASGHDNDRSSYAEIVHDLRGAYPPGRRSLCDGLRRHSSRPRENELELVFSNDPWKLNGAWGMRASGMTMTFNARAEPGRRLIAVKVSGRAIEDEQHYIIAGCERDGDVICRHPGTHESYALPMTVHQALKQYFNTHPVIAPQCDGREIALDLPPVVFSQDAVLAGGDPSAAPTTPSGLPL
jgi:S-sulfosulfanyl-L-cysteine sulfohydrolase